MGIEEELRRRRHVAAAKDIERRHRLQQAEAARLAARMGESQQSGPGGVHPTFAASLDAAKERARTFASRTPTRSEIDEKLERLRAEGKLPPHPERSGSVGYEPTAEEILGDLAGGAPIEPPDGVEDSPSPDDVLGSGGPSSDASEGESELAAPAMQPPGVNAPPPAGVAPSGPPRQPKNRRSR
jgi:hypothetical protein